MSLFTNHLGLILYDDAAGHAMLRGNDQPLWFVDPPLTYRVGAEDSDLRITVPSFNPVGQSAERIRAGIAARSIFVTDLGSTPQIAWSLGFSPAGPEAKAFVLHDFGYAHRGVNIGHRFMPDGTLQPVSFDRAGVDGLLLEAMDALGVDPGKARIIHEAVRLGGAGGWGS